MKETLKISTLLIPKANQIGTSQNLTKPGNFKKLDSLRKSMRKLTYQNQAVLKQLINKLLHVSLACGFFYLVFGADGLDHLID